MMEMGTQDNGEDAAKEIMPTWTLYIIVSSNEQGSYASIVLTSSKGKELQYVLRILFRPSNNETEHEALTTGMKLARNLGTKKLKVKSDS